MAQSSSAPASRPHDHRPPVRGRVRVSSHYLEYLASPAWRARVTLMVENAGNRCERCGVEAELHVHHLTYRNLYNELPRDLVVLCSGCHRRAHGRGDDERLGLDELRELADRHLDTFEDMALASTRNEFWEHYEETGDDRAVDSVLRDV